ncbi:hypothetical protein SAMN05216228_105812 [Rhizobium tibeticum]|uniref:Transposase n=1 Tax=Rhizobium tibeticum TaxID=501024 RepID=A0ABY1AX87_9HYPH|nr:hypothetical protein SAMN05216228_105812 [Rhizobium tibeticum]
MRVASERKQPFAKVLELFPYRKCHRDLIFRSKPPQPGGKAFIPDAPVALKVEHSLITKRSDHA